MSNKFIIGGICLITLLFNAQGLKEDYKYETIYNQSVEIESVVPLEEVEDGNIWCIKETPDGQRLSESIISGTASEDEMTINLWLKEAFKGNIYFVTKNNEGEESLLEKAEGIILELPETHDLEEHITFDLADCDKRTENGDYLYNGNFDADVIIEDKYSGIAWYEISLEKMDGSFATKEVELVCNELNEEEKRPAELGEPPLEINDDPAGLERIEIDPENFEKYPEKYEIDENPEIKILEKDRNLVTKISHRVKIEENEDSLSLKVTMRDNAGNESVRRVIFNVDKANPVIDINFHDDLPDKGYINVPRSATITITERAINEEEVKDYLEETLGYDVKLSEWQTVPSKDPDKKRYIIEACFDIDGIYGFDLKVDDSAGNPSNVVHVDRFVIDKTKPAIKLYFNHDIPDKGEFYAGIREAYIEINETNFKEDLLVLEGRATGEKSVFPKIKEWVNEGDYHTAIIDFKENGIYEFSAQISDLAGNASESVKSERFGIDRKPPVIVIDGLDNNESYNDDVNLKISINDEFTDSKNIKFEYYKDNKEMDISEFFEMSENGLNILLREIEKDKKNDGHYKLRIRVEDYAGNVAEKMLEFIVNRFGSTFGLGKEAQKVNGNYTEAVSKISVYETNIDEIDLDNLQINLFHNAVPTLLRAGEDFDIVKSMDGDKNKYTYCFRDNLFEDDGLYELKICSSDISGNENRNLEDDNNLKFVVDKTAPQIFVDELESGKFYQSNKADISLRIRDNISLADAKILVNGIETEYENINDLYRFTLNKSKDYQDIVIKAIDSAGNESSISFDQILVTGNVFIRIWHNKPALYGIIGASAIVLIINMLLLYYCKQKAKHERESHGK